MYPMFHTARAQKQLFRRRNHGPLVCQKPLQSSSFGIALVRCNPCLILSTTAKCQIKDAATLFTKQNKKNPTLIIMDRPNPLTIFVNQLIPKYISIFRMILSSFDKVIFVV